MAPTAREALKSTSEITCKYCERKVVNPIKCVKGNELFHPFCLIQAGSLKKALCKHVAEESEEAESSNNDVIYLLRIIRELEEKNVLSKNSKANPRAVASNSIALTSKRVNSKRKRKDDILENICGSSIDSKEEPCIDSDNEYEPNLDSESSDKDINENLFEKIESCSNIEPDLNNNNKVQVQNALTCDLSLNWSKTPFNPTIHAFDVTDSEAHVESIGQVIVSKPEERLCFP
ncbi:unnamed protein product [Brassicogethes aeneus]|uniref:Uncharacterized protein n=1 Tax=Brassicogethes aeneus TaxID=1431903 RepID=A0A9P0FKG4_BRAAE|nr:unnamed protein product [Brassicogethes aeneus]